MNRDIFTTWAIFVILTPTAKFNPNQRVHEKIVIESFTLMARSASNLPLHVRVVYLACEKEKRYNAKKKKNTKTSKSIMLLFLSSSS